MVGGSDLEEPNYTDDKLNVDVAKGMVVKQ